MRYLTLAIFLTSVLGLIGGCDQNKGDDAAMEETTMDEMGMDESAGMMEGEMGMEEMATDEPGEQPQWATLEQNVVHSEQ